MNSKPVVALPAVEDDLRAAIAHYATRRSDSAEHVLQSAQKGQVKKLRLVVEDTEKKILSEGILCCLHFYGDGCCKCS
jgi:hypothetical protein